MFNALLRSKKDKKYPVVVLVRSEQASDAIAYAQTNYSWDDDYYSLPVFGTEADQDVDWRFIFKDRKKAVLFKIMFGGK